MKPKRMIFLSFGHGGLDPDTGKYTTAPAKMFRHDQGEYHDDTTFYEGVSNREIGKRVTDLLTHAQIPFIVVSHEWRDMPLGQKVKWMQTHLQNLGVRPEDCLGIELHSNASVSHNVRGYEQYFYPYSKAGRKASAWMWREVQQQFKNSFPYRRGISGHGKSGNEFYMIRKTPFPFILLEMLFFDNPEDANLLIDREVQDRFARAIFWTCVWWVNNKTES